MKVRFYCDIPCLADATYVENAGLYARTRPPKWRGDATRVGFEVDIPDSVLSRADIEAPSVVAIIDRSKSR